MMGLKDEGLKVWLEPNDDPKKKLKYGWRLVEFPNGAFVCVDTGVPNRAVRAVLEEKAMPELAAYDVVRPEVKYGEASRIDFLLQGDGLPDAYVEVKSVTLKRQTSLAEFPDAVTARGAKHLAELTRMVQAGHRAVMLYLVQRTDCGRFILAADIDPAYAQAYAAARAAGVEVLCYNTRISPEGVWVADPVQVVEG